VQTPQENTNESKAIEQVNETNQEQMAFMNIDPTPLLLLGFSRVIVQGREPFIRMVTPRATPRNEDLAIIRVSPLLFGEVPFA
jgi:hypothetical protein